MCQQIVRLGFGAIRDLLSTPYKHFTPHIHGSLDPRRACRGSPGMTVNLLACEHDRSLVKNETENRKMTSRNPSQVGSLNKEGSRELGMAEDGIPHDGGVGLFT